MRKSRDGGYVALLSLFVVVAIIAAFYFAHVPGLPLLPGMGTTTGTTISADLNAVTQASATQKNTDAYQAQINEALKD